MKFKPISKSYDFSDRELTEEYPIYFHQSIKDWFYEIVSRKGMGYSKYPYGEGPITNISDWFLNQLSVIFRKTFPSDIDEFIKQIFGDSDLTSNFLAFILQNFARHEDAVMLELILRNGGSAFAATETDQDASDYEEGVYDLTKRIADLVYVQASEALIHNKLIKEAWDSCYSRNPDYGKTVRKCCDALEHILKENYEPTNTKPQLGLLLKNLQNDPQKLIFKGNSLLSSKFDLLSLVSKATTVRGIHTAGSGRDPTPDEAEFILHVTILIWNMHEGVKTS